MSDPRHHDDGLELLIDQLEQRVDFEAWRPRHLLGVVARVLLDPASWKPGVVHDTLAEHSISGRAGSVMECDR